MQRKDVRHWRKRFQAHGVRGLWDAAGKGSQRKITPEKEHAILREVLYGMFWNAKELAVRYHVDRSIVYRVFVKHGIVHGRWGCIDINHLKVLPEPLFGVTLSAILGLYYGTNGALALLSTRRPFSELDVVPSASVGTVIDRFVDQVHELAEFRCSKLGTLPRCFLESEEAAFVDWLNRIESRREPNADVCLLTDLPKLPPQWSPGIQAWLTAHSHFRVHYAPMVRDMSCWRVFVRRWFSSISALPLQKPFLKDAAALTKLLARMSGEERLCIITVTHVSRH
jgi:hypothetical protein